MHLWIKSLFPFHITVDDGAIVDVIFDSFRCSQIPSGFDRIMVEKALLWDIDISQMNVVNVLLLYLSIPALAKSALELDPVQWSFYTASVSTV